MTPVSKSAVMILKEFFGFLPNQTLQEFNAELKALNQIEKTELVDLAAAALGYTVTKAA